MSLAIDPEKVSAVLLADGWHNVVGNTFDLDSYEYLDNTGHALHGGGQSDVCATGFRFNEHPDDTHRIAGPLTAILAVRYEERRSTVSR